MIWRLVECIILKITKFVKLSDRLNACDPDDSLSL